MITFGWSLDLTRLPRRIAAVVTAVLAASLLVAPAAALGADSYDPATDMNSMVNTTAYLGATAWWDAGYTGAGVDVALIDTGVSPVSGLDGEGKVINGPDLSLESQNPDLAHLDTNGHGTFMAGLIAANSSSYSGVAPGARIVSLKVATADGGTDVSQVIAAIDWVIEHKNDNGLNIRVLNLSYGTNSGQDYGVDPLSYAVERAWKAGIVVVAAAGNSGYQKLAKDSIGLADPAYNLFVIGAGGSDSMGTAEVGDDTVGSYSATAAQCMNCKSPDFLAPGTHIQGLRVPNSYLDANHSEGIIDARYFRGSGTSEAAAITSGAMALILQKYPDLNPGSAKRFLADTATKLAGFRTTSQGEGEISLATAATSTPSTARQHYAAATGIGSLELARGSDHLTANGVTLTGEQDIFGHAFDSAAMASAEAAGNTWSGGTWNGNTWTGNTWSGNTWSGATWSGNSWSGDAWSGMRWSGNTWSGNTWSGNTWSGNSWSGNTWSGNTWSGGSWD